MSIRPRSPRPAAASIRPLDRPPCEDGNQKMRAELCCCCARWSLVGLDSCDVAATGTLETRHRVPLLASGSALVRVSLCCHGQLELTRYGVLVLCWSPCVCASGPARLIRFFFGWVAGHTARMVTNIIETTIGLTLVHEGV